MNRFVFVPLAIFALGFVAPAAFAQEAPPPEETPAPPADTLPPPSRAAQKRGFSIGPEVGVFLPSSGTTRDAFGNAWFNYGLGFGVIQSSDRKGRVNFDFNLLGNSRGVNRAYIAPIGVSYRRALSDGASRPYIGASANIVPTYLRADNYGVPSRLRVTGGGSVFAGYTFRSAAYLQARYYGTGNSAGFNFSGLSLAAGFRF